MRNRPGVQQSAPVFAQHRAEADGRLAGAVNGMLALKASGGK
ncbi:MAG: hypothetical protein ACTIAO_04385 [Microbacterium sp.]